MDGIQKLSELTENLIKVLKQKWRFLGTKTTTYNFKV